MEQYTPNGRATRCPLRTKLRFSTSSAYYVDRHKERHHSEHNAKEVRMSCNLLVEFFVCIFLDTCEVDVMISRSRQDEHKVSFRGLQRLLYASEVLASSLGGFKAQMLVVEPTLVLMKTHQHKVDLCQSASMATKLLYAELGL
jgi:hypothetical protein